MDYLILEGKNIILRKAKYEDYKSMLKHVWKDIDIYKWMLYKPTLTIEDAIDRVKRSIEYQKDNYAYFIALKSTDEAIGMCAIKDMGDGHFEESGICIGKEFHSKGYGKEVLSLLLDLAFNKLNAKDFQYGYFNDNIKSKKLAEYFNFKYDHTEEYVRQWDNETKIVDLCILTKEEYEKNKH